VFNKYNDTERGYAVTDHAAQSRTVTAGLALSTGTEDRQHAYVALSRGTEVNLAYVFTASPKRADPSPGPRPAPELARYDRRATGPGTQPAPAATRGEVGVPRAFRTVHPLGWTIWKGEVFAPTEEELLTGIQG
jgi:hypothetical protein